MNNEPAFPQPINSEDGRRDFPCEFGLGGMSLRDYFAAKAMQVILAEGLRQEYNGDGGLGTDETIAECAYKMADAMLAERDK